MGRGGEPNTRPPASGGPLQINGHGLALWLTDVAKESEAPREAV